MPIDKRSSSDHINRPDESIRITSLLRDWRTGDVVARDALLTHVYNALHRLAARQFSRERPDHTLQPTALVNEAFLNLDASDIDWQSRNHFYALAARTMRRILVDYARNRNRGKRGGSRVRVEIADDHLAMPAPDTDMLALDQALEELAGQSDRTARVLELTYFAGLTREAVADLLEVSSRTVDRDLKLGRAWLQRRLEQPARDG